MSSSGTIEGTDPGCARGSNAGAWSTRALGWLARRADWCSCLLGLCLLSPALWTGLVADDYLHELMLRDNPGVRGLSQRPFDLFRFADGQPSTASQLINEGIFPWWVDPKARLSFFRPLASLSHAADHLAWPGCAPLMHLHSLIWFGLLLVVVAAAYRRFGTMQGGFSLALCLFAIDDAHAPVVGWIANRNALIALCLALPALLIHDRQRREKFRHGAWLGPLCLLLGLLAGELAVCVVAYLVAYAACLDRGPSIRRYGALLPYLLVVVAWKLCCIRLGYGASGSGVYVDPVSDPIRFAWASAERLPVLTLALIAVPFADFWEVYPLFSPWLRPGVLVLALAVSALFACALVRVCRQRADIRFWTMGSMLSLLPMCATFPHDRMLLAPGIGAMAVIAAMLELGWARRGRVGPAIGAGALAAVHLALAPALLPLRALAVGQFSGLLWQANQTLPLPVAGDLRASTLILLNPPLDPFAAYLPVYREAAGLSRPGQQLWLATGASDVSVTVLDAHRLALRPAHGFLSNAMQRMLREKAHPFRLGERVQLDGASVEVTELTPDARPLEIVVHLARPLRDPSIVWVQWRERGYTTFILPEIGQSVVLPQIAIDQLLFAS
jgi:hypothetical protein